MRLEIVSASELLKQEYLDYIPKRLPATPYSLDVDTKIRFYTLKAQVASNPTEKAIDEFIELLTKLNLLSSEGLKTREPDAVEDIQLIEVGAIFSVGEVLDLFLKVLMKDKSLMETLLKKYKRFLLHNRLHWINISSDRVVYIPSIFKEMTKELQLDFVYAVLIASMLSPVRFYNALVRPYLENIGLEEFEEFFDLPTDLFAKLYKYIYFAPINKEDFVEFLQELMTE